MDTQRKQQLLGQLTNDPDPGDTAEQRPYWLFIPLMIATIVAVGVSTMSESAEVQQAGVEPPQPVKPISHAVPSSQRPGLDATGFIASRRQATVSAKIIGKISQLLIEEGDYVKQGQLIATLDNHLHGVRVDLARAELESAKASLLELTVVLQNAERHLTRVNHLNTNHLASVADLDQAQMRQDAAFARISAAEAKIKIARQTLRLREAELAETEIRAPFAGVVINKTAQPGEIVSPMSSGGGFTRTGICSLVDMDSLEIVVDVTEANINQVSPGQSVLATLNAYPDWQLAGEVITLIPTADRNRATVRVRIRILEPDSRILPDMGVRVTFNPKIETNQESPS